jgi:hypothetical protein
VFSAPVRVHVFEAALAISTGAACPCCSLHTVVRVSQRPQRDARAAGGRAGAHAGVLPTVCARRAADHPGEAVIDAQVGPQPQHAEPTQMQLFLGAQAAPAVQSFLDPFALVSPSC